MPNNDTYQTRDLGESSALVARGQRIIRIERVGSICWFVFSGKKDCQIITNEYWFGKCMVDAKTFKDATAKLKNRIFSN
jgi:hypothetical protein